MVSIIFKNVGQGDSIILEWDFEGETKIGIIDCNLYENTNPILNYLAQKNITAIEFLILSHFHYDHFSGYPDLFKYCKKENIRIKRFLHTLSDHILPIYDRIFTSKKVEKTIEEFFTSIDLLKKNIEIDLSVNYHTQPIHLSDTIILSFLAPSEKASIAIAKQLKRKVNRKEFCRADLNKFSTITYIRNYEKGILITSDAVKGHFRNLNNLIDKEIELIQAPHHGSFLNIYSDFWDKLKRINKCPIIFSVGNNPKDKLPNFETVSFFDELDFEIYSTNLVYGISEYFSQNYSRSNTKQINRKTQQLNCFSKIRKTSNYQIGDSKFEGDKRFTILN